jgi:hypothetical protein
MHTHTHVNHLSLPLRNLSLFFEFLLAVVQWNFSSAKICYQCDDKNPSSKLKIIGEKITKCNGVSKEKYASKTSKAFGAAVLTCFTVLSIEFYQNDSCCFFLSVISTFI